MSSSVRSQLSSHWRIIATAIMFMTRIPVGDSGSGEPEDLAASTQYFPLVGVIVGTLVGLIFWAAQMLWTDGIAVALCVVGAVMLTGGFHEDGLADFADSAGAWNAEKKLEIMRDSRIGTYGGLALVLSLILTILAITDIANQGRGFDDLSAVPLVLSSLILAHVLGRWSSLVLIYTTNYTRDDAANKVFVDGVNQHRLLVGSVITLVVTFACASVLSYSAFIAILTALACLYITQWWFMKSIGGITGDCLGAANKLVEITVYLSIAATLSA